MIWRKRKKKLKRQIWCISGMCINLLQYFFGWKKKSSLKMKGYIETESHVLTEFEIGVSLFGGKWHTFWLISSFKRNILFVSIFFFFFWVGEGVNYKYTFNDSLFLFFFVSTYFISIIESPFAAPKLLRC